MGNNDTVVPQHFQQPHDVRSPQDVDFTNSSVGEVKERDLPDGGQQDMLQYLTMGMNDAVRSVGKGLMGKLNGISKKIDRRCDELEKRIAALES